MCDVVMILGALLVMFMFPGTLIGIFVAVISYALAMEIGFNHYVALVMCGFAVLAGFGLDFQRN